MLINWQRFPGLPHNMRLAVTESGLSSVVDPRSEHATLIDPVYGFNLGDHVGDCLQSVQQRRAYVQESFGAEVLWLKQVHGCDVHRISALAHLAPQPPLVPECDASLTLSTHCTLAIMTADCLPVVFWGCDTHGEAKGIAAAHAGWKGLLAGVLQNTAMQLAIELNMPPEQIQYWCGPAIGVSSFEVGEEVMLQFLKKDAAYEQAFVKGNLQGKWQCDLLGLARINLDQIGAKPVIWPVAHGYGDTFTDLRLYSHRRSVKQGQPAGRFATLVRLVP